MSVRHLSPDRTRARERRFFIAAAAAAMCVASAASAAYGATGGRADPTNPLHLSANGISCGSDNVCLAVGLNSTTHTGEIVEVVAGKPVKSHSAPGFLGLDSISCPKPTSSCEAVGFTSTGPAAIVVSAKGVPGKLVMIKGATGDNFTSVSCFPSIASCEAVGQGDDGKSVAFVSLHNGKASNLTTESVDGGKFIGNGAISCESATSCEAVGAFPSGKLVNTKPFGFGVTVTSGKPAAAKTVSKAVGLNGISCRGGHCLVVGTNKAGRSVVATLKGARLSKAHGVSHATLNAISCSLPTNCTAVGTTIGGASGKAAFMTVAHGKAGKIHTLAGAATLVAVASSTDGFYEAVGQVSLGLNTGDDIVTSN